MVVKHIVLFKMKQMDEAVAGRVKSNLEALKGKVPGIIAISFGPTFTTDRAQGFTHALVVDLKDKEALQAYGPHPEHVEVLNNDLKPNMEQPPLAMDYEYEG